MSTILAEKKSELDKLRAEVMELEDAEVEKALYPKAKKLEGKYQKYRNCYSCPQTPKDYWFLYRHIRSVRPNGTMITDQFQTDKYGESHIKVGMESCWRWQDQSRWKSCSRAEWYEAVKKIEAAVQLLFGD